MVSNSYGSVTSSVVALQVLPPPPAPISASLVAGSLELRWPASTLPWRLEMQTNAPGAGLGTDWITVPNPALTNRVFLPLDTARGATFFRLAFP